MKLRLEDGIGIGLCWRGQRRFCQAHGIDFKDFVKNGIDVEKLAHIEDANLQRAIKRLTEKGGDDGRQA